MLTVFHGTPTVRTRVIAMSIDFLLLQRKRDMVTGYYVLHNRSGYYAEYITISSLNFDLGFYKLQLNII